MRRPVTVYLTDAERKQFERQAESLGMSLSAFMRWRLNSNGTWVSGIGGASSTTEGTVTFTWMPPGNSSVQGRDTK